MRRIYRATVSRLRAPRFHLRALRYGGRVGAQVGTVSAAALFVCTAFIGAQAPASPPQTTAPAAGQATAPPAGRGGLPGTESGWATFQGQCFGCHRNESPDGTPTAWSIRQLTPERIFESLAGRNHGGVALSDIQKTRVAEFMSGRPMGSIGAGEASSMPNRCTANPPIRDPASGPSWNGWGNDLANTRFQSAAAARLTAADVSRLKLIWAFGYPKGVTNNAQPTVVSGRVFASGDNGYTYSLDAKTGCVYWSFQNGSIVRNSPMVGAVSGQGATRWAVFFGDGHANVFALDAQTGRQLWKTRVDDHVVARITGRREISRRPRLRSDLRLRGVQQRQQGLPLLHRARRRGGARREHRQRDLEDVPRRPAEAVEEAGQRRAAVRTGDRRRVEFADDRSRPRRALRGHG